MKQLKSQTILEHLEETKDFHSFKRELFLGGEIDGIRIHHEARTMEIVCALMMRSWK